MHFCTLTAEAKKSCRHLEGASGLMGLIKCLLMFEHDTLLPNADFREMSPKIDGREKLKVLQQSTPWPVDKLRRICLTNFGEFLNLSRIWCPY
jgi:acyl transferase domain-containing protein